jgi:uncharacterized protein YjbI with pentapeptide repeats
MGLAALKELLSAAVDGQKIAEVALRAGDKWPVKRVKKVEFSRCDFRFVHLGGVFSGPVFESCVFRDVLFDGSKWRKAAFVGCEFVGCVVGDSALSYWNACRFEDCVWAGGRISSLKLEDCRLDKARFEATALAAVTFERCMLASVSIASDLRTVLLDRCELRGLDLSGSVFKELSILDCEVVGDFQGPSSEANLVIRELTQLDLWLAAVNERLGGVAGSLLEEDLAFLRETGLPICIDEESFEEVPRRQRKAVISIGRRALEGADGEGSRGQI